jgi:hypothetical protein
VTDLFEEHVSDADFALPGDEERVARARAAAEQKPPEPEPEAATGTDETPEAAPEAEATPETPAEPVLLAGKYKTPEDLERAYVELQQLHGRSSQEVGDLRRAVDELTERVTAPQPVTVTEDLIVNNPAYAAQLAYEQNNGVAFQQAFAQWREDDPFAAAAWAVGKQNEEQLAQVKASYDERFASIEKGLQPVTEQSDNTRTVQMLADRAATLPGLGEFVSSTAVAQMAQEFPDEAEQILKGTPDQKVRAFEKLFWVHRGRVSDTHRATEEQVARETAEAAQQARQDAFVASSTTANGGGAKPSKADLIGAEWDAMDAPYRDGWNVP